MCGRLVGCIGFSRFIIGLVGFRVFVGQLFIGFIRFMFQLRSGLV